MRLTMVWTAARQTSLHSVSSSQPSGLLQTLLHFKNHYSKLRELCPGSPFCTLLEYCLDPTCLSSSLAKFCAAGI